MATTAQPLHAQRRRVVGVVCVWTAWLAARLAGRWTRKRAASDGQSDRTMRGNLLRVCGFEPLNVDDGTAGCPALEVRIGWSGVGASGERVAVVPDGRAAARAGDTLTATQEATANHARSRLRCARVCGSYLPDAPSEGEQRANFANGKVNNPYIIRTTSKHWTFVGPVLRTVVDHATSPYFETGSSTMLSTGTFATRAMRNASFKEQLRRRRNRLQRCVLLTPSLSAACC